MDELVRDKVVEIIGWAAIDKLESNGFTVVMKTEPSVPAWATSTRLLTAVAVAAVCQVDLKTIHNWCERGSIQHFRTPGGHLRFKSADVYVFLVRYGYPVPDTLEVNRG